MPHPVALSGFSTDPDRYESGRPGYPPEAVRFLIDSLSAGPGDLILDVGAGTGKLTRELTSTQAMIVALDPVEPMIRLVPAFAPGAYVTLGVAERLPVATASVAAITAAQAFHWFDAELSWMEFARVLKPGGVVALMWNARLREVEWVDRIWSLMDRLERTAPWGDDDRPDRFTPRSDFSDLEKASFRHSVPMDEAAVVARVMSVSRVAVLPAREQARVRREISLILDDADGPLEITYRTDVVVRRRS
ncbi:MAG TPA: class I SAM-dependent methyltransferase [Acidimicrobiia bacterium]|jgi:SAM-dependent methyltransferase